jgi:hypothetical protein
MTCRLRSSKIKDRRRDATFRRPPSSPSEAIVQAVEATAGDQLRVTDRSSPRRLERCQPFSSAARRAGCSLRPVGLCMEGSTCWHAPSRSEGRIAPRQRAGPFQARCRGGDSSRPPRARLAAANGQASSRPSLTNGSSSCTASRVEERTRAEASRNCRRSSSREMESSSSLSERRITSVLDGALSSRRNRRTCACSAAGKVNDDLRAV